MAPASTIVLLAAGFLLLLALCMFAVFSAREREWKAVRVALLLAVATSAPFPVLTTLPPLPRTAAAWAVAALAAAILLGLLLPVGGRPALGGRPSRRVDERDIMFARKRLRPGTPEYESYYTLRPENRETDDRIRALPGLLSPDAQKADPVAFAAADAAFELTEALRDAVDGPVAGKRVDHDPVALTATLKRLARYHGAVDAGVCELKPYHVYSHVGRGTGVYGEPIVLDHAFALAFTVEMDHAVMRAAPEGPVVAESARQYVESAKIAIQVATYVRSMGYAARAHIDGNYRVIAPLVARDAGLGEIGRMGLVMTPRLGPRVRLGVVTTEADLVADAPGDETTVIDFCRICRKCAENCPPRAIPADGREPIESGLRWAVDAESCFRYWNVVGTDCGRCMTVCPYSHPDNAAHNLVRWAIRRSRAARQVLLKLDDIFYGRKPPSVRLGD